MRIVDADIELDRLVGEVERLSQLCGHCDSFVLYRFLSPTAESAHEGLLLLKYVSCVPSLISNRLAALREVLQKLIIKDLIVRIL